MARQTFLGACIVEKGEKKPSPGAFAAMLKQEWEELSDKEKRLRRKAEKNYEQRKKRKEAEQFIEQEVAKVKAMKAAGVNGKPKQMVKRRV